MEDKLIMQVHISLDKDHIVGFESPGGTVKMLPFTGTVEGEIFHGVVAPGGVDTQVTNRNQVRHMSARYMLVGEDCDGQQSHIYIDNEGWFTNGERPSPFKTIPTFITDSKRLAPYLHQNKFRGEGCHEDGQLVIKFYEIMDTVGVDDSD